MCPPNVFVRKIKGRVENLTNFEKLFSLATSPIPGLYFSDPYSGVSVFASQDEVMAEIPDVAEGGNDSSEQLGEFTHRSEMIRIVAKFIQRESLEIPIAIYCHFTEPLNDNFPMWSSMSHFYWLRPGDGFEELVHELDRYLLSSSYLYSDLVSAVSLNPDLAGATFQDTLDFTDIYDRHR